MIEESRPFRGSRRRTVPLAVAAAAIVVLLGAAALVDAAGRSSDGAVSVATGAGTSQAQALAPQGDCGSATTSTLNREPPPQPNGLEGLNAPEGMVPVGSDDGCTAGFIKASELEMDNGWPQLELAGRKTTLKGIQVYDENLTVVGYEVEVLGFVSLEAAEDPQSLEAKLAESDALTEKLLQEHPEISASSIPAAP